MCTTKRFERGLTIYLSTRMGLPWCWIDAFLTISLRQEESGVGAEQLGKYLHPPIKKGEYKIGISHYLSLGKFKVTAGISNGVSFLTDSL